MQFIRPPSSPTTSPTSTSGSGSTDRHDPPPTLRIELSSKTLATVAGLVAGLWLVAKIWPILIVIVLALFITGTLNPVAGYLERRGLRRSHAIGVVTLALVAACVIMGLVTLPSLWSQVTSLADGIPALQANVVATLARYPLTRSLAEEARGAQLGTLLMGSADQAMDYSTQVLLIIGYSLSSLALAIYVLADPEGTQGFVYALTPRRYHVRLARVLLNLETIVGGYMRGQVFTSVAMSLFAFGLLKILHVPNALPLAVFAGIMDVLPLVGCLLSATAMVLSALHQGSGTIITILVSMFIYQEIESRILVPRIYGRSLRLSSAAVIVALLIGGQLMGIVGAILALPFAAAIRMMITELRVDLPGDDSRDPLVSALDAHAESEYEQRSAGASPNEAAAIAVAIVDEQAAALPEREAKASETAPT